MNREDIIRMADEAKNQWPIEPDFLERFAALVASAEREACAKVCEGLLERPSGYQGTWEGYGKFKTQMTGQECATAIRARGNVATNDTSQERVDETSKNVQKPCGLECDCTDVCKQVDYKALWQQMCERCDELDKKLAQPEQDWIERERAVGYREGHQNALKQMAQSQQAPMNYYRADAEGNLDRTDIHFAPPEQHQDWCASLTQMLMSMPPKPAPCNCKPNSRKTHDT